MDYSDKFVQQQVENLTQTFENTSYISNPLYTESWLRSFLQYAERNEDYLNISLKTEDGFISALKEVTKSTSPRVLYSDYFILVLVSTNQSFFFGRAIQRRW